MSEEPSSAADLPTVKRVINASAADIWAVLSDGWSYASWVVGAARIRKVEPGWPKAGTRIHHSVGLWPLLISDHTEVLRAESLRELLLEARGWPAGEAHVRITLTPQGERVTDVEIGEDVVAGAGLLVARPARHALIKWRNTETLRRLAFMAEGEIQSRP